MRPAVPEYWRWTPADLVPFLRKPVSSNTRTATPGPQHQDRGVVTQVLDHVGAQIIAERIGVPVNAREERLHAVWRVVAGRLGEVPAVLPLQGGQQALKISQGTSARLRTPEPRGNPPGNRLQLLSPVLGFAPARHGFAPPRQEGQPAKPGCSTRCLVAERCLDQVGWAMEAYAWRFDGCAKPSQPRRS